MKKCRNNCIFCFINQLPENLRSSLYIKDDDYLESFKFGNFITLTNLYRKDIENILKYNLTPLYVSFHSADNNIRNILFGNKVNKKASDILKILDLNNIKSHIQIVLCPGINDGNDLLNTLAFLNNNFKNILSVGIVPVGITDFNKNPLLFKFEDESSKKIITIIDNYYKTEGFKKNVLLSDEFYIMAGQDFPQYKLYGSFSQIENGVGLCRNFIYESDIYLKKISSILSNASLNKKILILTSEYFFQVMINQIEKIKNFNREKTLNLNIKLKVNYIKNYFLGGNVKVAGLLSYHDFICWYNSQDTLNKKEYGKYDKILMPDIIFNKEGFTLDNKRKNDFLNIYKNIRFIKPDGKSFLKEIFDL
jgi:putative radical SAM enzyme (TIGR03279 family)